MMRAHDVVEEREAIKVSYYIFWLLMPYLRKSSTLTPEKIAKPFISEKPKDRETLLEEKEYYMKMMKEG